MYRSINSFLQDCNLLPITGKVLGISGIDNFYPLIDKTDIQLEESSYPEVDMQAMPYKHNTFDFVISDQVIEHLEEPTQAINESYRVLKPGGIAIHTTCFLNYLHFFPRDLWRFSPDALRYLCRHFSEVLSCEGWGNRLAILLCFIADKFRLMKIPDTKWSIRHLIATYNEYHYPIVTWIIARK